MPAFPKSEKHLFKFSIVLYALVGLSLFLTGLVYLTTDEFMSYHGQALQLDWSELTPELQSLILGFLKGLGSGALIAGSAVLLMAGASLKTDPRPYVVLLPVIAIGYSALLCYATYTVYTSTPGQPPLALNLVLVATSVLASALFVRSHREAIKT